MIAAINMVAAAIVLAYGVTAINQMGRITCNGMRITWIALTTGALGVLAGPIFGYPTPGICGTVLHVGIALHVIFERRRAMVRGFP
jgi:hypothetical protein